MKNNNNLHRLVSFFFVLILSTSLFGCSGDITEDIHSEIEPQETAFSYAASVFAIIPGLGSCNGKSFQGFAVHNDVAFCFYDSGICRTVDLNSKRIISQFNLPAEANHPRNHAGVACFSVEYFKPEDEFPLLYLSSYQEYKCYVLRVTRTEADVIQTIYTYKNAAGEGGLAPVLAYEPDGHLLLLKLRDANYHWITIRRPDVHREKSVYINLQNKIDEYEVRSTSAYNAGFALNGRIYQLAGYQYDDYKLYILDYVKKKVLVDEHWSDNLMKTYEQEQCARYKNGLLINYNRADHLAYVEIFGWKF